MSPSIGPCCYEVGEDVMDIAAATHWGREEVFYPGRRPGHTVPGSAKNQQ